MNFYISIIVLFVILWIINFYFFGMQRAVLMIRRVNDIPKNVADFFLPNYYALHWLVSILKWIVIIVSFKTGWVLPVAFIVVGTLLQSVLPIPYRSWYYGVFQKRIDLVKAQNKARGETLEELLRNAFAVNMN